MKNHKGKTIFIRMGRDWRWVVQCAGQTVGTGRQSTKKMALLESRLFSENAKKAGLIGVFIFLASVIASCEAAPNGIRRVTRDISDGQAIRAIYGEACGEPYVGKLAVAGALRNRGTLRGVYGKNSPLLSKPINSKAWNQCVKAWSESATNDITHGASHWENTGAFGENFWTRKMQCTGTFGHQRFFKP